jgi:hypothetical protein
LNLDDSTKENVRRNLIIISLGFILYHISGAYSIPGKTLNFSLLNISFANSSVIGYFACIIAIWFWYRFYQVHHFNIFSNYLNSVKQNEKTAIFVAHKIYKDSFSYEIRKNINGTHVTTDGFKPMKFHHYIKKDENPNSREKASIEFTGRFRGKLAKIIMHVSSAYKNEFFIKEIFPALLFYIASGFQIAYLLAIFLV